MKTFLTKFSWTLGVSRLRQLADPPQHRVSFRILTGPIAFLLAWYLITALRFVDPFLVPGPVAVFSTLVKLCTAKEFWGDLVATLYRVAVSFGIATIFGVPLGLLLGSSRKLYGYSELLIDFFRSIPATALFPLFLLLFGIGDSGKIAVTIFSSALIILFNTAHGVLHAKKARLLAARIMGATPWQTFRGILFWESLPQTFVGLRSAISLSLIIIIVTEMFIGSTSGLGHQIIDFQITYEIPSMYAVIIIVGLLGYVLNLGFALLEKHFLHWSGK